MPVLMAVWMVPNGPGSGYPAPRVRTGQLSVCGICGIAARNGDLDLPATTGAMNRALEHRGPDDSGSFQAPGLSLAMSRLAIIDVAGGHQPLGTPDGEVTAVFNGEIYNHPELRSDLESLGHRFRTRADTEVLVHGYRQWGTALVEHLAGMFAFCIYDREAGRLLLARDRFGEKPLFYHHVPGKLFAFASEVRSLLACPAIERRADPEAITYYLRCGFLPAPLTGLVGVHKLEPGHTLELDLSTLEVTTSRYFHVDYSPDPALRDEATAIDAVRAALDVAVQRQAVSDVPLGAFLSGGIDSSAVVARLMATASSPVQTFTVRFEDAGYDESDVARGTAAHLGTDHHEIVAPNVSFEPEMVWRIVDHVGTPFYDSSVVPTYLLSKQVREHVKVVLSGDGGDEMFGGYPKYRWGRMLRHLQRVPSLGLNVAHRVAVALTNAPLVQDSALLRQARRGLESARVSHEELPLEISSIFGRDALQAVLADPRCLTTADGSYPLLTTLPPEADEWSELRRLMYFTVAGSLPGDMLTKVDSMSMACSLEVRAPMLDVAVYDVARRLPDELLIHGGEGKYILKRAIAPDVPARLFDQPKSGFSVPLHRYQNAEYETLARQLLAPGSRLAPLFRRTTIDAIIDRGVARQEDAADTSVYRATHQLWTLVILAAWAERFEVSL